jgi:hypothetical protein
MMTQQKKQQAIFPDLPRSTQIWDPKTGEISNDWLLYFSQLTMALQTNFKPEGIVVPPKPSSEIANLGNGDTSIGNIIYDSTVNQFKGIILVSMGPPIMTVTKTFTLT